MTSEQKGSKIQITLAVIGLIGVLGAAIIANWDKLFPPQPPKGPEPRNGQPRSQPEKGHLQTEQLPFMVNESGSVTPYGQVGIGVEHPPQAGDLNNNVPIRGFLSFDLTGISRDALLHKAELNLQQAGPQGEVFPSFGTLTFEALWYGLSLTPSAYDSPAYALIQETYGKPGSVLGVTGALEKALKNGHRRFQVRFRFAVDTDRDNDGEIYWVPIHSAEPTLQVVYRLE